MTMGVKLSLGLGSIAVMLLVSSIISVVEYGRMSNYVSDLVATNIRSINIAQKLAKMTDKYNLEVLAVIGDEDRWSQPEFDTAAFMALCDTLRASILVEEAAPLADSVQTAFVRYMSTSYELPDVLLSDFIDSRGWYFFSLQPLYTEMQERIDDLSNAAYNELKANSLTFQASFYRSIIPGIVSVGAGLVLVFLLLFFILVYYVRPVNKMVDGIGNYFRTGARYKVTFDGQDQLASLNEGITEVVEENVELKKRNKNLRDEREHLIDAVESLQE